MRACLWVPVLAAFALPTACGGSSNAGGSGGTDGGGAADGGASGASGTGGGGFVAERGCAGAADCSAGAACVEVASGGYKRCTDAPAEATSCPAPSSNNECCATADCPSGKCFPTTSYPTGPCGGGGADVYNKCRTDECSTDADCAAGTLCAPAGVAGPVRTCFPASCRVDADCSAEAGGACVWIAGGCCGGIGSGWDFRAPALACAYPSDGCQRDATDCPDGQFCVIDAGRAHCSATCH